MAAFPCFLLSLIWPGVGQIAAGATTRGRVLALLAATIAALPAGGIVPLPGAAPFDGRHAGLYAALILLSIGAAYDAWFRVRERRNGMLPHLPRTPRVAFLADALWGGAGRLYLESGRGLSLALVTLVPVLWLAFTGHPVALVVLALWNFGVGVASWSRASRRFHDTPAYRECQAALDEAPFASPRAPSPSLPLVTLVAVLIGAMGAFLALRTAEDRRASRPAAASGRIDGGRFIDDASGLTLPLPDQGWTFAVAPPPLLLTGRRRDGDLSFTLAAVGTPLFRERDLVPAGALARFAARQERELAAGLPDFELLARQPIDDEPPGLRLLFRAGPDDKVTVQEYLLVRDRIVVLTLTAPAAHGHEASTSLLRRIAAGLATGDPDS